MYKFREPVLDQYKSIWLTQKAYNLLRDQKKKQKKTLAQIVEELILKKYAKK